ncbi:MAG: hypothetical protein ACXABD_12530 [Candidatus Thorarchaeota archaeon]|jgi:hypothetical protein
MPSQYLDDTPYDEGLFGGKLITGREGFLVGKDNYVELRNMRYSTGGIGIETRYGMRRFNDTGTAVTAAADIDKIWQHLYTFEQTRAQDVYVVTDTRKLYKADSIPESSAGSGSLGTSLYDFTATSGVPSFCAVNNHAVCSSKKDLIGYSGATPYPAAVLYGTDVGNADTAADEDNKTFQIITDEVTNADTTREVQITLDTLANNEAIYVGYWQPIRGITFAFGSSINNNASTIDMDYWNGSAWTALTETDGTADGGAMFAQDGSVTWTYIAVGTEVPRRINGQTLFWYRIQTNAALDAVDYRRVTVLKDWRDIQDLTDGRDILPSGFVWMDDGDDPYNDILDKVLVDSKSLYASFTDTTADEDIAAADEMYVGFPQRVIGIRVYINEGYHNDGNAATITVSYWDGTAWQSLAADEVSDGTLKNGKMFNQTGEIRMEDKGSSIFPMSLPTAGIKLPMYWYKIDFSAKLYNDLNDEMRIWKIRGIPAPLRQVDIQNTNWVADFKDRLFMFGPQDGPNTAHFSAFQMPYALSGDDTSRTWPRVVFGDADDIVCAVKFFNEMIVFKRQEVWMMEGDSPDTFGTLLLDDTLGCVAPETAKLVRTWVTLPDGRQDFRHAVFFMSHDGIWAVDGIKIWKVSHDIDNYFNIKDTATTIKAGYRDESTAFFDPNENEYHVFFWYGSTPTLIEFVYNTEFQKWTGPFIRGVNCVSGASVIDSNDDRISYGGGIDGRLYRLEIGSSDVNSGGSSYAIESYVELGDAWTGLLSKYAHRGVFLFGKAQTAGNVNVDFKGDGASTAADLGNISMIRSGYATFIGRVNIGSQDSAGAAMENKFHSARLKFSTNTIDVRQELFGFLLKKADVSEAAAV